MNILKQLRSGSIIIVTMLLTIPMLGGCSIPSRWSGELNDLQAPASPVLQNVYDRSVDVDVYSSGRHEQFVPEPSLEAPDSLQEAVR
ncbi:hypothetical protein [Paenibacillus faecalis]|uniref:hypothetical protein n=1 Tax=Paenibacillus faecalis TaxID=2079532 RepID=UPI000D0EE2F3|nr:hypothetical protein [Paenibacillus faecalis]